jgi:hypothetical protein
VLWLAVKAAREHSTAMLHLSSPVTGEREVSGLNSLKNHFYGGGMTQGTHRWCLQDGGETGKQLTMVGSWLRVPTTVKAWSGEPLAPGTASAAAVAPRQPPHCLQLQRNHR